MSHDAHADVAAMLAGSYDLRVESLVPGPRQFVAETFVAVDRSGRTYFCKATYKHSFIPAIVASLEAIELLHGLLPDRTCRPVRSMAGALHVEIPGGILVVFDFVPGEVNYDYSYLTFGAVLANVHELTSAITCSVPALVFDDGPDASGVIARLELAQRYEGSEPVLGELGAVARRRLDRFRRLDGVYRDAARNCRTSGPDLVMTHGDAPGNVMVRSADDFTLIDWDEGMLAPAERDLWIMEHEPDVLRGYCSVRPGFTVDPHARLHAILTYMFSSASAYLQEVEAATTADVRRSHVHGLDGLLDGWMSRLLAPIERDAER